MSTGDFAQGAGVRRSNGKDNRHVGRFDMSHRQRKNYERCRDSYVNKVLNLHIPARPTKQPCSIHSKSDQPSVKRRDWLVSREADTRRTMSLSRKAVQVSRWQLLAYWVKLVLQRCLPEDAAIPVPSFLAFGYAIQVSFSLLAELFSNARGRSRHSSLLGREDEYCICLFGGSPAARIALGP